MCRQVFLFNNSFYCYLRVDYLLNLKIIVFSIIKNSTVVVIKKISFAKISNNILLISFVVNINTKSLTNINDSQFLTNAFFTIIKFITNFVKNVKFDYGFRG